VRGLAAFLVAAAVASPVAWAQAPAAGTETRVAVEVFSVGLGPDDGLLFARREGDLRDGANPDGRARALSTGDVALIHSTSWRWEPDGRIVLTYLAWAKEGTLGAGTRKLPALTPPASPDPLHPRPVEIAEVDPLAHGLRHLTFLLHTSRDGAVAAALGPRGVAALSRIEADVAGELPR